MQQCLSALVPGMVTVAANPALPPHHTLYRVLPVGVVGQLGQHHHSITALSQLALDHELAQQRMVGDSLLGPFRFN